MRIFHDIREADLPGPTFLTLGNFDGLHRGHQMLLTRLRDNALAQNGLSAILTFDPHPLTVLRPHTPLELLTSPTERLALAADQNIGLGVIQPFTPEFAQLEPKPFLELLFKHLGVRGLTVGPDFALGRNRSGTLDVLSALGRELGITLDVVQPVQVAGQEVRSFAIRQAVRAGEVDRVAAMLGRVYTIGGPVIHGNQRGRTIGVPTANLSIPPERLLPGDGVYATWAWIGQPTHARRLASVTNIGMRPTIGGTERRVESHLFDFPGPGQEGDLYGQSVTLGFVQRLRQEQRFASFDLLVAQIQTDIAQARALLRNQMEASL